MKPNHKNILLLGTSILIIIVAAYFTIINPINLIGPLEHIDNKTYEKYENFILTYEIIRYPAFVTIDPIFEENITIGISNDPYNFGFGIIPVGSSGRRFINMDNTDPVAAKIKILAFGEISDFLFIDETQFILYQNESRKIPIQLKTTADTSPGNYTGEIDLIVIEPKYNGLEFLLWVI